MSSHLRRAAQEHGTRRTQANGVNGHGPTSHSSSAAATRAYHNSHAYAVSQQPLFTSWNLPDYLAHLEPMLPTETPRPLEVRRFEGATNGTDPTTTERGVKVKWPSKRMSVVDMNKRVRSLLEWVGREQAVAAERNRRKEAVETALKERAGSRTVNSELGEQPAGKDNNSPTALDNSAAVDVPEDAPSSEARDPSGLASDGLGPEFGLSTMKQMEELMLELINFQERFGPGAKLKERERRTAAS
jgi:hypothetical protein